MDMYVLIAFVDFCGKHFIYKINPQADPGIPAAGILLSDKSYIISTEACSSSGYFGILLLQSNVCTYYDHENIFKSYYNNALIFAIFYD